MTAKEFMNRAYRIRVRIKRKREQLAKLLIMASRTTGSYGSEQVAHSRNTSSLENSIIRILEHEKELEHDVEELCKVETETQEVINLVADDRFRILLQSRYINGLSWDEVAADCGVCKRQAHRWEGQALKMVETVLRTKEMSRHA